MASPRPNPDPRQVVIASLVVATVVAGFGIVYLLSDVLFLLFVGMVLATALEPMIETLQRRHVPQLLAVSAVYAFVILDCGHRSYCRRSLCDPSSQGAGERSSPRDPTGPSMAGRRRERALGKSCPANPGRIIVQESPRGTGPSLATVGQTASYLAMAAHGLLVVCGVVLLAFYWSLQGDRTVRWVLLFVPVTSRDGARQTIAEIERKVGAYLRGQGVVCLAMAAIAAAVYGLLGLRYALVLGIVAGIMEVLPLLGPLLAAVPPLSVASSPTPGKRHGSWSRPSLCSRSKAICWFRGSWTSPSAFIPW